MLYFWTPTCTPCTLLPHYSFWRVFRGTLKIVLSLMNCGKWLCFQNTYSKYNYTFVKALDPVEKENRKKMVALIWVQFFRVKLTLVSFAAPPSCKKKHSRVLFGSSPLSLWFHPILSRFCSHQSPKNLWVLLGFDSPDWELVKMSSIRRRVMSGDCQALPYLPRKRERETHSILKLKGRSSTNTASTSAGSQMLTFCMKTH